MLPCSYDSRRAFYGYRTGGHTTFGELRSKAPRYAYFKRSQNLLSLLGMNLNVREIDTDFTILYRTQRICRRQTLISRWDSR